MIRATALTASALALLACSRASAAEPDLKTLEAVQQTVNGRDMPWTAVPGAINGPCFMHAFVTARALYQLGIVPHIASVTDEKGRPHTIVEVGAYVLDQRFLHVEKKSDLEGYGYRWVGSSS